MMGRRLIVASFLSLDGVVENPAQWGGPFFDEAAAAEALEALNQADYFLLGRHAYEYFHASWPLVAGNPYMDRANAMPKLVASRTIESVSWNATLVRDAARDLARLKAEPGGDIIKYGVTNLDATLLRDGLVDEYHITLMPVVVGTGKRAFADVAAGDVRLELTESRSKANGVVSLRYKPCVTSGRSAAG